MSNVLIPRFQRAAILILPLLLLLVAGYAASHIAQLPPARYELALITPYLIAVAGLALAVHFHRGRPFFALTLLGAAYWLTRTYLPTGTQGLANTSLFNLLLLFVPLNLMILTTMREKGVFTAAGRLRMAFLCCQVPLVLYLHRNFTLAAPENLFTSPLIMRMLAKTAIPHTLLVLISCELLLILFWAMVRQSPIDSGLFGATVSFVAACNWLHNPSLFIAFSSAAAAIITVSILQDSYNMAFKDELTGIPSRRALNEQLHGIGRTYAIAMVDIDHFKKFNDTYGHDVGDQVLKLVAKKLAGVTGGGKAYRYGGEEFTILFPRRKVPEVMAHLEEIRECIATYKLQIRDADRPQCKREGKNQRGNTGTGISTHVTVSIGVADSRNGELDKTDVIKEADKALYKAKNKGRNQVCT